MFNGPSDFIRVAAKMNTAFLLNLKWIGTFRRAYSTDTRILSTLDSRNKSQKIQSSIKLYLKKVQEYENTLESEREDFERGRKYLAQLMGEDPDTFNQDKIDESIKYLFPSSLFSPKARPKLKPPEEIYPKKKKIQCDSTGRPLHDLFYTRRPQFYSVMHEAVYQLEALKMLYDNVNINKDPSPLKNINPLILVSTEWLNKAQLEDTLGEAIMDDQFEQWLTLMNRIASHPLAHMASEFIFRYRVNQATSSFQETYPQPELDPETQRYFIKSYGQKRHSFAEATVYMPGSGQLTINDKRLLEMFPDLGNREQLLFPLQVTKTLNQVDIVAKVTETGTSSPANALRLAISRCLASLLPDEQGRRRLLVCGLLTQDNRFAERKNPGQKKARKKPIWKAR